MAAQPGDSRDTVLTPSSSPFFQLFLNKLPDTGVDEESPQNPSISFLKFVDNERALSHGNRGLICNCMSCLRAAVHKVCQVLLWSSVQVGGINLMTGEPQITTIVYFGLIGCNCTIVPPSLASMFISPYFSLHRPDSCDSKGISSRQRSRYEREIKECIIA